MFRRIAFVLVVVGCFVSSRAGAQTLADKLPDDAILYVGWSGSESLGAAYDASHLKAMIAESNIQQLFTVTWPQLAQKIGAKEPEFLEFYKLFTAIGEPMWRHPSALYLAADTENPAGAPPRVILLCNAGKDAAALEGHVRAALAKKTGPTPMPINVKTLDGGLVAISTTEFADKPTAPLMASPAFKTAMANVAKDSIATIYVDVERAVALADAAAPKNEKIWPGIRDALGLGGFKSFAWTGSFDGKDWLGRAFIASPPDKRSGLMFSGEIKPLPEDVLKAIPVSATMVGAGRFDFARFYDAARDAAVKFDANGQQQFDQAVQFVNQILNLDVRNDLLDPLGDSWAYYTDPNVGGSGILGITLINKLDDPAKAEQALTKFEKSVTTLLRQQLHKAEITIQFAQTKVGDLTIHYLATPAITPAWTIKDGNLYVALYPQVVASAARAMSGAGGKSILDNPSFVAVRKRLGDVKNAQSIQFMDLPKTAADSYQTWLLLSRLYLGMGDLFGAQSPAMLLPPLDRMMPHLAPAGAVTWTDDAGWHSTSISPFPASTALAGGGGAMGPMMVGEGALVTSILLPSLNRARETANRVKCASNLRQLGLASIMYANDHRGKFPPDMGALTDANYLSGPEVFICPSTSNAIPPELRGAKPDALAAWVNANANYVYVGAGKTISNTPNETVLLYEEESDHDGDGVNVCFGDCHVEWFTMPNFEKLMAEQGKGAAKPAPDAKPKPALPKDGGL